MAATIQSEAQDKQRAEPPRRRGAMWKAILFRGAAVLLGLSPLLACELTLRALRLGKPTDFNDPFVGFSDVHPLFVLNQANGRYEIPKSRQTHFQPESFAAKKPAGEFRIFVLGGSTVQGRPWSIETSFTTWLELNLNAADRARTYEVVNCGGVSYATYRLVPILQEVLKYEPDLIIFCEGHNEFLEDRSYGSIKRASPVLAWPQRQVSRLRTYNVLREGLLQLTARPDSAANDKRAILGPEADARLDWKDGIAKYHRDAKWQADVIAHFEISLQRIAAIADGAGVPLIFVSPVSNLQWAPFKSQHREGITPAERNEFESLLQRASELDATDTPAAVKLLRQALTIDDQHAGVHYEIGLRLLEMGMSLEARPELVEAKDLDVCPLRMLEPMKSIMHDVAAETGTPLVDADALLAAQSRSGFPDRQWLVDHVHPTMEGHQLIAGAIAAKMAELGFVQPEAGWEAKRDQAYREHLASLSVVYFQRGKDRLRSEQGWAHGKVQRVKP
ncbi:MAG TPA: SGNH/GDSL hydrolase family protein [Pirellulaceae bacterium]|nr:SGNH/GDSL hydrolase family protein [Pirellulaceae bacterium]